MTLPTKAENAIMRRDELDILAQTHHPAILEEEDRALADVRLRIRSLLDKERTIVRGMRRSIRGKAEQRGGSFPGEVEKPARRKQVLAAALQRLNKEFSRRRADEARDIMRQAARRALALKGDQAGGGAPPPGRTSRQGMQPVENRKRRTGINRDKVGSISQRTKNAQAAKDARS